MTTHADTFKYENQKTNISENRLVLKCVKSFCYNTFSVGVNYAAALFNVSPSWLLGILLIFAYRDHRRLQHKFRQQVAMSTSLRNDKQLVVVNVNHRPPSWVHFPEIENCEWINRILYNIWPIMNIYTEKFLKNIVEPKINEAISSYKKNSEFRFHTIRLGDIVPRICGLKVFKNNSRQFENIILDVMLSYTGDTEIYFYLMSLGGGVQNLEINGCMRIVFKIVKEPIPFLGGIEIFFTKIPKVDFDFSGAMGILKIPGISGMLHKTLDDLFSQNVVLPNKITMKMNDIVDTGFYKCPDPEAFVRIHVIEAKNLRDNSSNNSVHGTSDTYVVLSFGSKTVFSDIFENSLDPVWKFWANFMIDSSFDEYFVITVNERSGNQCLGKILIELNLAKEKKYVRSWVQLEDTTTGMVHLEITYYSLSYNPRDIEANKLPCALIIFINNAFNLINRRSNKTPNSVIYLEIDKVTQVSKSVLSTDPVFEEIFIFVINGDPKNSKLKLKLVDINDKSDLGNATLQLKQVSEASYMEVMDRTCPLMHSDTESSLSMSMRLRILIN